MWKKVILICVAMLSGCYDLSTSYDDHVITDFRILAMHAEPPAVLPNTPVTVSVLYADPSGETVAVSAAWRVGFFSGGKDKSASKAGLFVSTPPSPPELVLPPPSERRVTDKGASPSLLLDLYLCTSSFDDPTRILSSADDVLIEKLCPGGTLALGRKEIETYLVEDVIGVSGLTIGDRGMRMTQHNPLIDSVTANGLPITAIEDGGDIIRLCDESAECRTVELSVSLDPSSLDNEPISLQYQFSDGGDEPDAGELIGVAHESLLIDWYVTGGTLSKISSPILGGISYSAETFPAEPSVTEWRIPETDSVSVYTLYVVVRDERGGNSWKTYRFSAGKP